MNMGKGLIAGMAMAAMGGDLISPGQARRMEKSLHIINRQRRWRGMINCNESPWVTYRHDIKAGKCRLIKRRNKPPLLIAIVAKQFAR